MGQRRGEVHVATWVFVAFNYTPEAHAMLHSLKTRKTREKNIFHQPDPAGTPMNIIVECSLNLIEIYFAIRFILAVCQTNAIFPPSLQRYV